MINFSYMQNELKGFGGVIVSGCRCVYVRVCVCMWCVVCVSIYIRIYVHI